MSGIIELNKSHAYRKRQCGYRVQVARVLIRNKYRFIKFRWSEDEFCYYVESILDNLLAKHDYNLELVIDMLRQDKGNKECST